MPGQSPVRALRSLGQPNHPRAPIARGRPARNLVLDRAGLDTQVHFGSGASHTLYLGTNDNKPYHGDESLKFSVRVVVRRNLDTFRNVGRAD